MRLTSLAAAAALLLVASAAPASAGPVRLGEPCRAGDRAYYFYGHRTQVPLYVGKVVGGDARICVVQTGRWYHRLSPSSKKAREKEVSYPRSALMLDRR